MYSTYWILSMWKYTIPIVARTISNYATSNHRFITFNWNFQGHVSSLCKRLRCGVFIQYVWPCFARSSIIHTDFAKLPWRPYRILFQRYSQCLFVYANVINTPLDGGTPWFNNLLWGVTLRPGHIQEPAPGTLHQTQANCRLPSPRFCFSNKWGVSSLFKTRTSDISWNTGWLIVDKDPLFHGFLKSLNIAG